MWRGFSGNNSGECVLVGKFESSAEAERFLAELSPTWVPDDEQYSAEWRALFEREHVALAVPRDDGEPFGRSPSELVAVGRSVIATSYDAEDAFPDLRALTWKRAGFVVPGGIHLHDGPSLLAAIRGRDADDVRSLAERFGSLEVFPHGDVLFVHVPEATRGESGWLAERARLLTETSAGRPLGVELVLDKWDPAAFLAAKQRLGSELETNPRLFVIFHGPSGPDEVARLAGDLSEATATPCRGSLLIEGIARRKRAAVLAARRGGRVSALDGDEVEVHAWFWFLDPPTPRGAPRSPKRSIDVDSLRRELTASLGTAIHVEPVPNWRAGAQARITTGEPARVLATLTAAARALDSELSPWVSEVDPLAHLLRRLLTDVR